MKKLFIIIIALTISASTRAADLNMLQIMQLSNYTDISLLTTLQSTDVVHTDYQPVYLVGYYFNDLRFQNIGVDNWMFRGLFKMKGIFLSSRYIPDLRYLFVENKKPVGGHWYFTAGRINPVNLLPVQRLDGVNIAYTPNDEKGWLFGLVGGMMPTETSGYRNLYYNNEPFRIGAYAEYKSKSANHYKLQYNAGFGGPGTDMFHQGQLEITQKYQIFKLDSFIRGGVLYTYPYNTFDYAFAENSLYTSPKVVHSVGYLKSQTIFVGSNDYIFEDFQQAFYRFGFTSDDNSWHLVGRAGYTYSMQTDGFIGQIQLMKSKLFSKQNGQVGVDILAQKKGVYEQYNAKANFGLFPIGYVNISAYAGYEYFKYRTVPNNAVLYGVTLQAESVGGFSYDVNLDFRSIPGQNTEAYLNFNLIHYLHVPLGKREEPIKSEQNTDKNSAPSGNPDKVDISDKEKIKQ